MLVSTPPGCTTESFTGLFAIASSCRRLSEKPRTANFAAQYAVWPGGAMMPKIEERLTICASRCFARCGRNARVPCTTPQKLMLISHSICAWSTSLKAPSSATPALLMTMLSEGWAAMAAFENSWICAGSPTSTRCVVTLRVPALPISAATCCSPASSRSASARSQPRAASSSASARPMPLAAPVTAAALPDIAVMSGSSMQVEEQGGFPQSFRKLEPNHKAVSALNLDYRTEQASPRPAQMLRRLTHGTIKTVSRDRPHCRRRPDAAGHDLPAAGGERGRRHRMRKRGGRGAGAGARRPATWF